MKKLNLAVNLASSIDGKIATGERGPVSLGSSYDKRHMHELRARADVVMMGAETFRAYPFCLKAKGKDRQPATVVISSRLAIPLKTSFVQEQGIQRIIFCGRSAPRHKVLFLKKKGVQVIQSKNQRPSALEILTKLSKLGFRKILLEGGGGTNAAFFEAGLVDRIYLTFCPVLVGGEQSPSIFEGKGFRLSKLPLWKLVRVQRYKNELYLIYDKTRLNKDAAAK